MSVNEMKQPAYLQIDRHNLDYYVDRLNKWVEQSREDPAPTSNEKAASSKAQKPRAKNRCRD